MKMQKTLFAAIVALSWAATTGSAIAGQQTVASPSGDAVIHIEDDASRFSVRWRGEAVVAASPLGLELDGAPAFGALALDRREDTKVDREIPLVATKASVARARYRGATLTFRATGAPARRLVIDVRAYDDGVAFRYRIDDPAPVRLVGERTAFVLSGDPECLVTEYEPAHERPFQRLKISQLSEELRYDVPMVCTSRSGRASLAIAQAHLEGYAGASLQREGEAVRLHLSAVPGRAGPAFVSEAGLRTAWRVVMLGDRPGDMIASHLIGNLNPSPEGDFSWVVPGKAAWDWWSGPLEGVKPDLATYHRFIDFAAESGFPYYLIDAGWSWGAGPCCEARPTTDVTRAAEGIDMPGLVRYAADKGVGLLLWVHWEHLAPRMDEVLDTYARWGI
ncbi:MAG TPA: glycoside hydrolase family 97 N-terminal domain-containing protein, partial [Lysobacter sp.]|nr:glycoside hydrolase family 97 N-terminal domain-containing protein [Lysobacter sp.]